MKGVWCEKIVLSVHVLKAAALNLHLGREGPFEMTLDDVNIGSLTSFGFHDTVDGHNFLVLYNQHHNQYQDPS